MAVCTTDTKLGKLWLQRNFSLVQPFYHKYYRTCIVNFNILADDYHIRLLKRNIKEFQTLMQRIESGEIIVEESLPPLKKKKFIGIDEIKIQPPFRKETLNTISNSKSSTELSKNKSILTSNAIDNYKDLKTQCRTNDYMVNGKSSNENNSIVKPYKMSITLQDENGKVYNKKENLINRSKQGNNTAADTSNLMKFDESYYAENKTNSDFYQQSKVLEKSLDDLQITKILQPNRLKQGETFSSVLQQSLNKEKCLSAVLKQTSKCLVVSTQCKTGMLNTGASRN